MAGVGFELRKLFNKKEGYVDTIKAYSISAIVTEGPMILCILMLFGLRYLISEFNGTYLEKDIFVITITYTMIFSMLFSNSIILFVSRYVSDCLYEKKYEDILSAFYSAVLFVLLLGGTISGIFIATLDLYYVYKIIIFIQFNIVMITWIQLTFLSALKKYTNILMGFFIAVIVAIIVAIGLMYGGVNPLMSALLGSCLGYFTILSIFLIEIMSYYPKGNINLFKILEAVDKYKILLLIGLCMTLALYGHNFVMWGSEYSKSVLDVMRFCTMYDIPTFYGSMSIIFMLVIFTVSLETNFYIKYKEYFNTVLYGGRYKDVQQAYKNMKKVLLDEILKMCQVQFFFTIMICMFGVVVLKQTGMDTNMIDIFRKLCFAYYFYGVQRCLIIVLLYFDDRKGALISSIVFLITSILFSFITRGLGIEYYGIGFFVAALVSAVVSLIRLHMYLDNLDYNVFCKQPLFISKEEKFFTRLAKRLYARMEK